MSEARARGGRVIVIDPVRTQTARSADQWIGLKPGSDAAFMLGIAHYLGIEVIFDQSPENARNIIAELGEFYRRGFGDRLG